MTFKSATRIALVSQVVIISLEFISVIIGYPSSKLLASVFRVLSLSSSGGILLFFYILLKKQNDE